MAQQRRARDEARRGERAKLRSDSRWNREKLLWVALLIREAERRGESPRAFVEDRMIFVKDNGKMSASPAKVGDLMRKARYLLEHDWKFQTQVDCYRIEDV